MSSSKTLSDKVWEQHVVRAAPGEPDLLYIDLHLVHEVTSPQAFDGLRLAGRPVRRPDLTIATADHNVPTVNINQPIADPISATQVRKLSENCREFGVRLHPMGDPGQGIVHVIGPEFGLTQPGPPLSAAIATPRPMEPLVHWRSVSAPAKWNTFSPRKRFHKSDHRRCR